MPMSSLLVPPLLFWKALVFQPLCGARVPILLDGTDVVPVKTLAGEDVGKKKILVPNIAYTVWITMEVTVHGFIVNS
jgi:hypothetical protein